MMHLMLLKLNNFYIINIFHYFNFATFELEELILEILMIIW